MTLAQAVAGFHEWLREHNIDSSEFRLVLSFPDARTRFLADAAFNLEMDRLMYSTTGPVKTDKFELHGIDVRFETRPEMRTWRASEPIPDGWEKDHHLTPKGSDILVLRRMR